MLYLYLGIAYVILVILFSRQARRDVHQSEPFAAMGVLLFAIFFWPLCLIYDVVCIFEK